MAEEQDKRAHDVPSDDDYLDLDTGSDAHDEIESEVQMLAREMAKEMVKKKFEKMKDKFMSKMEKKMERMLKEKLSEKSQDSSPKPEASTRKSDKSRTDNTRLPHDYTQYCSSLANYSSIPIGKPPILTRTNYADWASDIKMHLISLHPGLLGSCECRCGDTQDAGGVHL